MTVHRRPCPPSAGFTLVELSMVLVIIGLIVGAILVGRDMIRGAERRALVAEAERYSTAINVFREKYACLPGDCANATQFFPAADGGDGIGGDCEAIATTTTETCNGNGDGRVFHVGTYSEKTRFFQQLASIGLIKGSYTGVTSIPGYFLPGTNVPTTPMGGGFEFQYFTGMFNVNGHFLKVGQRALPLIGGLNGPLLSPVDAIAIDLKIDDGSADTGSVMAVDSATVAGCVTGGTSFSPPSSYIATNATPSCRVYFWYDH